MRDSEALPPQREVQEIVDDASLAQPRANLKTMMAYLERNLVLRWIDRKKSFHDCLGSHLPNGKTRESKAPPSEDEFGRGWKTVYESKL